MSEHQVERVSRIFDRINNIQSNIQSEKQGRFQIVLGIIQQFELNLQETNQRRLERFESLESKLRELSEELLRENQNGLQLEGQLDQELKMTQRNSEKIIEQTKKERIEGELKLGNRIQKTIETVSQEVYREAQTQSVSHSFLEGYLQEELPKLKDELNFEIAQRKDVEEKIYTQFTEQINELKEAFDKEIKSRENREEEILGFLREIQTKISQSILKIKRDREKTEEMLVMLVEKVIEKMKKEMVELDI